MGEILSKTDIAILKALNEIGHSAGASRIAELLNGMGFRLQPRSIRFHLLQLDKKGLTKCEARRKGRIITRAGLNELERADVIGKVGFVSARVDSLIYRMTFDMSAGTGSVVPNVVTINSRDFSRAIHYMTPVFGAGLFIGGSLLYKMEGQSIGGIVVPKGKIGIATICSMTVNGIFLKEGIPVTSRFGALLEMKNRTPVRFIELIDYRGTSVDPLKLFILSQMTNVYGYSKTGNGVIGASFREFPSAAYEKVRELLKRPGKFDLSGIVVLGRPNMPLFDIPVGEGRTAMIIFGGLNPVAALHESGVPLEIRQLGVLEEIQNFVPFKDVAPIGWHSTPFVY